MKKHNSEKKFSILDDYFRCNFFKSKNRINNRFKSINNYKNNKLEILLRKAKNKEQNIFELINFQDFLLKNSKFTEIKDRDGNIKYIKYDDKILGRGGLGSCYLFRSIDKEDMNFYAGKIINKEKVSNNKKLLLDEINIQKKFKDNSKVVRIKDYFEDDDNIYFILELCKNKSLLEYLKKRGRLNEIEVKCFIFQLLQGLKYLHQKKIIHRSLKPSNLLLDNKNELKIGDFGLAAQLTIDKERIFEKCGTPPYMAPEIFENNGKGYSFEVDIWSVGIIMYQLLTGNLPFDGYNMYEISKEIWEFQPENLDVSGLSVIAADLIKQILVKDPKKRPGINQIVYHYFFHDIEFPKYINQEFLNKIDKEKNKEENIDDEEKRENLKMKLYSLIVDDIPVIEYESIKNYVIKESVDAFQYYITYYHESTKYNYCYYEFNNEIIGMIFKIKKTGNINMIYNTKSKIFYHININENNKDDEIKSYKKEELPEKLKKYSNFFLDYYKKKLKKRNIIEFKDENPSFIEQNSSSKNTRLNGNNSLSNENLVISQNKVLEETNLIYLRKIIVQDIVTILFLSDKTIEAIFCDKIKILISQIKNKIEIINQDNKISVVSTKNVFQNSNIDFKERLKLIRSITYKNISN